MSAAAWLKTLVLWIALLVLAIANGAIREQALIPAFGSSAGLTISGVTLCICIFTVALLAVPWYGALDRPRWIFVGLLWVGMTLLFEFAFGRFVRHESWAEFAAGVDFRGRESVAGGSSSHGRVTLPGGKDARTRLKI